VAAIFETSNRLLNTNGSVEATLLQRVGKLYMLSISVMKSLNTLELFDFYLLEQEKDTLVAERTNDGRRASP